MLLGEEILVSYSWAKLSSVLLGPGHHCHGPGEWQFFSTELWSPPLGGALIISPVVHTWWFQLYLRQEHLTSLFKFVC